MLTNSATHNAAGCAANCGVRGIRRLPGHMLRLVGASLLGVFMALSSAAPAVQAETIHVIQPGDSLGTLSQQYNVDAKRLAEYNAITEPNHIVIGRQIRIPADTSAESGPQQATPADAALPGDEGYHTVAEGESLSTIARRYGVEQADLLRLNNLENADKVLIGQHLRLTARVEQASLRRAAPPEVADAIHVVEEGDTLTNIAERHNTTAEQLMADNGLPNAGFVYTGQRLRIQTSTKAERSFNAADAPPHGERRIVIDLSDQTLTAYQGDVEVLHTVVSTGKASTPTKRGEFEIYLKYESQHMVGPDYDLPGVPWVMYYDGDFGIHGAYWHTNFGVPVTHGCTNMRIDEAEKLYEWAEIGTPVSVQW